MDDKLCETVLNKFQQFPVLPSVITKLYKAVLDEETTVIDISKIIETDSLLVSRLLKLVNSPFYGLRYKVSTIPHAVAMLGLGSLKNFILGFTIYELFNGKLKDDYLNVSRFWQHSLSCASISRSVARMVDYPVPEEAYAAGILHDVGKIILNKCAPDKIAQIMKMNENLEYPYRETEKNILGFDHAELGGWALKKWNIPVSLQEAVSAHHDVLERDDIDENNPGDILALIVAFSDYISWSKGFGVTFPSPDLANNKLITKYIHLTGAQEDEIIKEMDDELKKTSEAFDLPQPDMDFFRKALEESNIKLAQIQSLYQTTLKKQKSKNVNLDVLDKYLDKAKHSYNVKEIIKTILDAATMEFNFERAFLFFLAPDKQTLKGVGIHDETHFNTDIRKIVIPLDKEMLNFLKTLVKKKFCIAAPDEHFKAILESLDTEQAGIIPLSGSKGILGLIIVDNIFSMQPVDEQKLQSLAIVTSQAGLAIENAQLYEDYRRMKKLAEIDPLTGIKNRRNVFESIQSEFYRSKRYHSPFSLLMVDLDGFKEINDIYGHQFGDAVLKNVANIIRNNIRNIDVVGRYGGDEFIIILPQSEKESAIICAERLRKKIGEINNEDIFKKNSITMTASIGGVSYNHLEDKAVDDMITRADKALYAAKERGKDRICFQ